MLRPQCCYAGCWAQCCADVVTASRWFWAQVWCVHCLPDTVWTSLVWNFSELSKDKARAGSAPPKAVKMCLCKCCPLREKCNALTLPHTGDTALKTTLCLGEWRCAILVPLLQGCWFSRPFTEIARRRNLLSGSKFSNESWDRQLQPLHENCKCKHCCESGERLPRVTSAFSLCPWEKLVLRDLRIQGCCSEATLMWLWVFFSQFVFHLEIKGSFCYPPCTTT